MPAPVQVLDVFRWSLRSATRPAPPMCARGHKRGGHIQHPGYAALGVGFASWRRCAERHARFDRSAQSRLVATSSGSPRDDERSVRARVGSLPPPCVNAIRPSFFGQIAAVPPATAAMHPIPGWKRNFLSAARGDQTSNTNITLPSLVRSGWQQRRGTVSRAKRASLFSRTPNDPRGEDRSFQRAMSLRGPRPFPNQRSRRLSTANPSPSSAQPTWNSDGSLCADTSVARPP